MAWNIPGKKNNGGSGGGGRSPWKPTGGGRGGGGGAFDGILDLLRRLPGGGGGGPLRWIAIALVVWLLFSSFVLIGEQQRGVVLRFGQAARVMQPGPNFKAPWPIERVIKVNATSIRTFSNTVPVLTRDENIVVVSLNVQYRVGDPEVYLFGTRDAERVLEQVAQGVVREQVGRSDLDTVLGARGPLSAIAKKQLQDSLDIYRTGLIVTELNLQDARPPEEVKPAFDAVNSAQQVQESLVNEARAYAAKIVPEARGEAARTRTVAEGYKTASIARASGDAARFTLLLDEYRNAPEVTRKRLWLQTLEQVLADNRKVVGGDGRQLIYVPMAGQGNGGGNPPVLPAEVLSPSVGATREQPSRTQTTPRPTRGEGGTR
ncbi:FtsH protease activity modulator HflK [Luteimonas sp. RD2P54]|uniref:Protein HflK n=1 Tax=Luteimonas endophytica TaxID=3042023 RepID=A0ABT6JCZ9_9GAMM|nr:FtsH protease activity modulator HflK [Luteimonas endophytica]MDH5824063.1 FtsH protease activity modulator HflK [Luteimonas endophytica]